MRNQSTFGKVVEWLDKRYKWHRFPTLLGVLALIGIRGTLRARNLFSTDKGAGATAPVPAPPRHLVARTTDGSYNDLAHPTMGMAKTRFGRNVPLEVAFPEVPPRLLTPNPRTISTELLVRHEFKPATTLNVLAAAWLQFETRDWFSHGTDMEHPIRVPRPSGDDWPDDPIEWPSTPKDPTNDATDGSATFINTETHWWDASQMYGSTAAFEQAIRTHTGGRVRIGDDGLIDVDPALLGTSGGQDGWWVGLELMHTLFMREHNAICDRLVASYPSWNDDQIFDKARLINAALIAKIHTVEWTPAILGHPVLQIAMRANWWGLAEERVHNLIGRLSSSDLISGIPGSPTDHHGVPYAMTEEFVAVYRMHPLIPDDYEVRDATTGEIIENLEFMDLHGLSSRTALQRDSAPNLFYSLGVANPGALRLHNHPRFMHRIARSDGKLIDVAAIDVLRSRERGVPRYNEFRRLMHMEPVRSFEELGDDPETVEQLRRIYDDKLEDVDLAVGMLGEQLPRGFGFSDTAFRIFVLMASRRLKSDRFFGVDFNSKIYTPEGMAWIDGNDMSSVIVRHYPELESAVRGVRNAFAPWPLPTT